MKKLTVLFFFFLTASVSAQDLQPLPELYHRVTDQTGTLTNEQMAQLEEKLQTLERTKGSQIAVVIIPTTEPEPIEDYTMRLAEQWKIGREGVDDGVILLVAKNDRRVRIEVGYGLEGAIPDAIAKRIIDNYITPSFRKGNFYAGINEGVDAIITAIAGEPLPQPRTQDPSGSPDSGFPYFFLVIIFVILAQLLRKKMGKWKAGALGAGVSLITGLLVAGLGAALIMVFIYGFISIFALASGRGGARGYYGGGFFGGRGGGGFGGGGGFSGGGGSFGGGGASGSW